MDNRQIYLLNWQVQHLPNNQTTQAIDCNAMLTFERHRDEQVDDRGFLIREAFDEVIAPLIPCVYSEYTGRPDYAVGYNTPGITADHLLTVQVQWNARTRNLRTGDEFSLLHSRYRIISLVGTELDLRQERGILNLMARKAAGEEAP